MRISFLCRHAIERDKNVAQADKREHEVQADLMPPPSTPLLPEICTDDKQEVDRKPVPDAPTAKALQHASDMTGSTECYPSHDVSFANAPGLLWEI